jgi:hypothetical protein
MKYNQFDNKEDIFEMYRKKKPIMVVWDLDEKKLDTVADKIAEFIKKWEPEVLMVTGPCKTTKDDIDTLVKEVLIRALK